MTTNDNTSFSSWSFRLVRALKNPFCSMSNRLHRRSRNPARVTGLLLRRRRRGHHMSEFQEALEQWVNETSDLGYLYKKPRDASKDPCRPPGSERPPTPE